MKIHELTDLKDTSHVLSLDDERGLDNMDWSEDGQLLAVSTTKVPYESRDQVELVNMDWSEDGRLLAVSTTKVRVM